MINNYKRKVDLRENMYFRTTYGKIDKILDLNDSYVKGVSQKDNSYVYDLDNIVKASHNIIDILEVGDYVNGHEVKSKQSGFKRIDIGEDENYVWLYEENIKSVVTHEQMEQMAYKVEE